MKNKNITVFLILNSFFILNTAQAENGFNRFYWNESDYQLVTEFNLLTEHSDSGYVDKDNIQRDYNENNDLYTLGIRSGTWTFAVGTFDNSYDDRTYFISGEHNFADWYDFEFNIGLGVFDGYDKDIIDSNLFIGDIFVAPLFSIAYKPEILNWGIVQIAPKFRVLGLETYALNVEIEIDL